MAIDPGPVTCGLVIYCSKGRAITITEKAITVEDALEAISTHAPWVELVAIERVQSMGQAGASLFRTCEVVGRLHQRALDVGLPVRLMYRREVCSVLHVSGAGKDAQVRQRMIEAHGGSREVAVGTKKSPGALHGVASHAWQALGLAYAAAETEERTGGEG